jgi:hypothetical protein
MTRATERAFACPLAAPIDLTLSLAQPAGPAVRLVYTRSVNTPR